MLERARSPSRRFRLQVGLVELDVEGAVPEWLEGDLYRTGPGLTRGYTHFFDGLAMLVNFRFDGGKISWQQRFVQSEDYAQYRAAGAPQFPAFGFNPGPIQSIKKAMIDQLGLGTGMLFTCKVSPPRWATAFISPKHAAPHAVHGLSRTSDQRSRVAPCVRSPCRTV